MNGWALRSFVQVFWCWRLDGKFMFQLRFLIPLTILFAVISLFIGVGKVSIAGLMAGNENDWLLFIDSRLPRLIAIAIAGASLSVCGLVMQCLSRNRFVSPTTAGLEDSARLGVLLAIIFFASSSNLVQVAVAAITTFAGSLLFATILRTIKHRDAVFIPLVGMMLGNIINAFTVFFALQFDLLQNIQSWLQGDFSGVLQGRYETLYISIPALILIYFYAQKFILAGLGESFAVNLGLNYKRTILFGLICVSIATASVVATVGVIPFLGLIVPNIVALYIGDNLQKTLPHTAVMGILAVLMCDILARLIIYPYEVSVSLIMGVIGSIIFLTLLIKRYRYV